MIWRIALAMMTIDIATLMVLMVSVKSVYDCMTCKHYSDDSELTRSRATVMVYVWYCGWCSCVYDCMIARVT